MNSAITNTRCLQKNLSVNVSNLLSHLLYMSLTPRSASSPRARLPTFMRQYSSKLDQMRGPLRTTSDGNLVYENTGDWLVLDTPSHDAENPSQKEKKNAPTIDLPEVKNGATGDERPRKRMLFSQYVSHSLFRRKQVVSGDPDTLMRKLHGWVEDLQDRGESKVDMQVLEMARRYYGFKIAQMLGGDWFEHALVNQKFWSRVLEEVARMGLDETT
jgi:hypothetical protein